jgi:putative FmdB family regulatory protein
MPLYEYQCRACGRRFEAIRKLSDADVDECPTCGGGPVARLLSSPAIQFKGTGWYITDYARKGKSDGDSPSGEKKAGAKQEQSSAGTADKTPPKTDTSSASPAPKPTAGET